MGRGQDRCMEAGALTVCSDDGNSGRRRGDARAGSSERKSKNLLNENENYQGGVIQNIKHGTEGLRIYTSAARTGRFRGG